MNKFLPTFWLTYIKQITSRSFIITTAIFVILIIGLANIDKIIGFFDHSDEDIIAVSADNKQLADQFIMTYKKTDKHKNLEEVSASEGKKGVKSEKYKQLIEISKQGDIYHATIYGKGQPGDEDAAKVQQVLTTFQSAEAAQSLNLSQSDLAKLSQQADVKKEALDKKQKQTDDSSQFMNTAIVYIGLFLIFFVSINYGSQAATDIAMEKSSRVIEMIVTSVSPVTHLMSKILAVLAVALTQLAIYALTLLICMKVFNLSHLLKDAGLKFTDDSTRIIIYAVIFMLLGIIMNIALSAIIGGLTNRVEDIGQAVMPVTFLNLGAFYIAIFSLTTPDTLLVKIASYFPFFTPMVMLLRTLSTETTDMEIIIGIIICAVTAALLLLLAARVYKGSVFSSGKGLIKNFRQALQMK